MHLTIIIRFYCGNTINGKEYRDMVDFYRIFFTFRFDFFGFFCRRKEIEVLLFVDMSIQNNVLGPLPPQASGSDPYGALGNFDVIKTLGHGHFSVVYSARNRFTDNYVALKKVEVRIYIIDKNFDNDEKSSF